MGDLLALDGALEGEVVVIERLDLGEAGGLDPVLAAVGFSGGDFFGEDGGQVGLVVLAFLGRSFGQHRGASADARRFEGPGQEGELRADPGHGATPTARS